MLVIYTFAGIFSGFRYKIVLKIKCLILSRQSCGKKYTKIHPHWYNTDLWANNKKDSYGYFTVETRSLQEGCS